MRKFFFCILLVINSASETNAQKSDPSWYKLYYSTDESDQWRGADSLFFYFYDYSPIPDSLIKYSEAILSLTESQQRYDDAIFILQEYQDLTVNDPDRFSHLDSIFDQFESHVDQLNEAKANPSKLYFARAAHKKRLEDIPSAVEYYQKSIDVMKADKPTLLGDSYLFLGINQSDMGDVVSAIQNYEKAYDIYSYIPDSIYMFHAKSSIIVLLGQMEIYDEVEERLLELQPLIDQDIAPLAQLHTLYNQANNADKQGKLDDMLTHLTNASKTTDYLESRDTRLTTFVDGALVKYYCLRPNLDSLNHYYSKMKLNREAINNDALSRLLFQMATARYQYSTGQNQQAIKTWERLDKINNDSRVEMKMAINQELANAYRNMRNYASAYQKQTVYTQLKDSLLKANNRTALLYYQTKFETKLKNQEIAIKSAEIEVERRKRRANTILMLSLLAASILCFSVYFLYRSKKQVQREKELQADFTSQLLQKTEREKKRISENLHDGVGQSLMLIKNKIHLNQDAEMGEIVDNIIQEVRGISQGLHPFQLDQLGLTGAIESILNNTDRFTDIFVTQSLDNIDNILPQAAEIQLFRTVQELINNVVKHSESKALRFGLNRYQDTIKVRIQDNGKGFDFTEEYQKIDSLGLKTIKERIKVLDGKISFDTTFGEGTIVEAIIPIP